MKPITPEARLRLTTPEVRLRLINALGKQHRQLVVLFQSDQREAADLHYAAAGILRSMLCDARWPTLLSLAAIEHIQLPVWGPLPSSALKSPAPSEFTSPLVVSTTRAASIAGEYMMPLSEYLKAPVGAIATGPGDQGQWYTASKLIKWIANKEGPSHFEPKRPAALAGLETGIQSLGGNPSIVGGPEGTEITISQSDNLLVRFAMLQLMQMAIEHSAHVLKACGALPKN